MDGVEITKLRTEEGEKCLRIEIWLNDHYQNVDLGLKFLLEASNPKNNPSRANANQKIAGKRGNPITLL